MIIIPPALNPQDFDQQLTRRTAAAVVSLLRPVCDLSPSFSLFAGKTAPVLRHFLKKNAAGRPVAGPVHSMGSAFEINRSKFWINCVYARAATMRVIRDLTAEV